VRSATRRRARAGLDEFMARDAAPGGAAASGGAAT